MSEPAPSSRQPAVWGNVPQRNKNFTGREDLLHELHERVTADVTAVLPRTLRGLGGVGKTQLAAEYAYRYQGEYDVVWWISADQPELARAALASLSLRLNVTGISQGRREDLVEAVREALRTGEPYRRWLLVFDNADQPESIRDLIPSGPGHVLVTSRNQAWESIADTLEVDVFSRPESLAFLRGRVPSITEAEAGELAERLGDLPIALEQAGALQVEGGMSADEYLELMDKEASKMLAENRPQDYPVSVAAAWSLSVAKVREHRPTALELLRLCAFFGPEPIPSDLLKSNRYVLGPPIRDILAEPERTRAIRELGRYALVRVDNYRKTLQVHRLIQRLIQDDLAEDERGKIRHEVHLLLAAADPDDPDNPDKWPEYQALLAHAGPADVVPCSDPTVRRFTRNLARYLYAVGDLRAARPLAERALAEWSAHPGQDERDVFAMSKMVGDVLWSVGEYQAAHDLRRDALARSRETLGEDEEETLLLLRSHASDLRARGDFAAALDLDIESESRTRRFFGDSDPDTFRAINNLALDYALTGDYRRARELDEQNYEARRDFFGRDNHPQVLLSRGSFARDLRQGGEYQAARDLGEQVRTIYQDLVRQRTLTEYHGDVLQQVRELAVARRKVGDFAAALEPARDVYARCRSVYREDHPETLAAATSLSNTQRITGEFDEAARLIEETLTGYQKTVGPDHPYTYGCALNMAIVRRQQGDPAQARALLEEARSGLEERLGPQHHITLTAAVGLASALAGLGDHEAAADLDRLALDALRQALGEDHPHTLAAAANLGMDLKALGRDKEADALLSDTLKRYRRVLGERHPDTMLMVEGNQRQDVDFEPSPL